MSTNVAKPKPPELRSEADGGIIAEVRLDHGDLLCKPTMERAPEVTVELEYRVRVDADRTVCFLTAYADEYDAFETALAADPTVAEPVLVDRYPDRRVYRVVIADEVLTFTETTAEIGGRLLSSTAGRDGWTVQLRLPDRDALIAFNEFCRERDVTFQVNHLRVSGDGEDGVVGLTPKQQELLTVAYEEGYFDVPRGISQNELADRLNVSKSAISQRLRRAMAELCGSSLE